MMGYGWSGSYMVLYIGMDDDNFIIHKNKYEIKLGSNRMNICNNTSYTTPLMYWNAMN